MSSTSWFRPVIAEMNGYAPGTWPQPSAGVLKLNSNENPYPPSPQVLEALIGFSAELLRRYPDPQANEFCRAISETFDIPSDWIIAGNGSDDLLTLLVRACAEGSDRPLAYPTPTYVLYQTLATMQPAGTLEVPYALTNKWALPVEQLLETDAAITLIATPNSPTGHVVPLAELRTLAENLSGILVIDEAYVDFRGEGADRESLALVREFENVIVLRTLSKGYSLAGLRLGFGFAQLGLLAGLKKVKDSYNVDALALKLGTVAIADQTYKNSCVKKVVAAREQLAADLRSLRFQVWPSEANFLLVKPPEIDALTAAQIAQSLCKHLKQNKIMIRYFPQPGLEDKLRITVGTPEQNKQVVRAIAELLTIQASKPVLG